MFFYANVDVAINVEIVGVLFMRLTLMIISILEVCRENLHICTVELRLKKTCEKAVGRSLFLEKISQYCWQICCYRSLDKLWGKFLVVAEQ